MKVTETHKELDTILSLLNSDNSSSFSLIDIIKYLYPAKYKSFVDETKGNDIFDVQTIDEKDSQKVYQLVIILKNKGLLFYNEISQLAMITVKGVIQVESETFEERIERKDSNLRLQRWSWKWLPIIGFGTLIFTGLSFLLSLFKFLHDVSCLTP